MHAKIAGAYAFWGMVLMCATLIVGGVACGKKGPPVAPKRPPLPQVTTLEGRLESDTVYLSWRPGESVIGIKTYVVLRSQTDPVDPPCEGCPRVFQRVGEVTPDPDVENFQFSEPTLPGFVYIYKVQPVGASGDTGPESNAVTIDRTIR